MSVTEGFCKDFSEKVQTPPTSAQTAEATSHKGAARKISSISTVRCGHRTLRRGSIKAYFVGVDDHIDPRLQGTNQGLGYTLTWQNGRQLASMRFGTVNIGFTYDVDGLRTSKTVHNVDLEHKLLQLDA